MRNNKNISQDSLFNGSLVCYQNKHGYRFSIDSVLLAHFTQNLRRATVLDLGCGCGVMAMILLYRRANDIFHVEGIEYQRGLAELAQENSRLNNLDKKCTITTGDYTQLRIYYNPESFSNVICNPPFYSVGRGRPNSDEETYLARHQVNSTISDVAKNTFYVLQNKGILTIVYPADQSAELISILVNHNLQPKKVRFVYSYPESSNATLVLLECKKNGGTGVKIASPLFVYDFKNGPYSAEVAQMYQPNSEVKQGCDVS